MALDRIPMPNLAERSFYGILRALFRCCGSSFSEISWCWTKHLPQYYKKVGGYNWCGSSYCFRGYNRSESGQTWSNTSWILGFERTYGKDVIGYNSKHEMPVFMYYRPVAFWKYPSPFLTDKVTKQKHTLVTWLDFCTGTYNFKASHGQSCSWWDLHWNSGWCDRHVHGEMQQRCQ